MPPHSTCTIVGRYFFCMLISAVSHPKPPLFTTAPPPELHFVTAAGRKISKIINMAGKLPEQVFPVKAHGWAAHDSSGILSPFNFSRRYKYI